MVKSFLMFIFWACSRRRSALKAWNVLMIGSFPFVVCGRMRLVRLLTASFEKVRMTMRCGL